MLMRKVGKHGAGKWGLPGGSADSKDRDDLATAEREAKEEVGGIPSHEVKGQILIKRCGPRAGAVVLHCVKSDSAPECSTAKVLQNSLCIMHVTVMA